MKQAINRTKYSKNNNSQNRIKVKSKENIDKFKHENSFYTREVNKGWAKTIKQHHKKKQKTKLITMQTHAG